MKKELGMEETGEVEKRKLLLGIFELLRERERISEEEKKRMKAMINGNGPDGV